jgi:hypothetical protein
VSEETPAAAPKKTAPTTVAAVIGAIMAAATPGIIASVNSCDAERAAANANAKTAGATVVARTADRELDGAYAEMREKIESARREFEVCRSLYETLREELMVERRRFDKLVGRRTERKIPDAPPMQEELRKPLPATPAAAAAAAAATAPTGEK